MKENEPHALRNLKRRHNRSSFLCWFWIFDRFFILTRLNRTWCQNTSPFLLKSFNFWNFSIFYPKPNSHRKPLLWFDRGSFALSNGSTTFLTEFDFRDLFKELSYLENWSFPSPTKNPNGQTASKIKFSEAFRSFSTIFE